MPWGGGHDARPYTEVDVMVAALGGRLDSLDSIGGGGDFKSDGQVS